MDLPASAGSLPEPKVAIDWVLLEYSLFFFCRKRLSTVKGFALTLFTVISREDLDYPQGQLVRILQLNEYMNKRERERGPLPKWCTPPCPRRFFLLKKMLASIHTDLECTQGNLKIEVLPCPFSEILYMCFFFG